ncbi:MAG: phosphatase PAP2 family protein [Alphaproteobacteria bacterium]
MQPPPDKGILFRPPYTVEIAVGLVFVLAIMFRLDEPAHSLAVALGWQAEPLLRGVTSLGDSAWYLIPLGIVAPILFLVHRRLTNRRRSAFIGWLAGATGFLFASVAAAGIAVNILKVIVGRARPKFYDTFGATEFAPFTFGSDYASFPSGHANTSFAIAVALSFFLPRLRPLLLAIATAVALSRIGVGMHYLSDVAAGALLATVVVYELRRQCAQRRIVFARDRDGIIRLRGPRLRTRTSRRRQPASAKKPAPREPVSG